MQTVFRYFTLLFIVVIIGLHAESLEQKYPSYSYVFNEFDVDEAYFYDDDFVKFVKKHEKNMKKFYKDSLRRGEDILPMMQGLLIDDGVSDLFIYLSMVESGFSLDIVSPKKAVGLWQFMPKTAKQYNLSVCSTYDERCDAVSATSAAIDYLNKLHKQFGKWYLAAMAYNCGEGCIQKAIKRARSDDLAHLTDENMKYVPKETRTYIKKILLVAMIGESMTLDFESDDTLIQVEVDAGTSLAEIATLIKMDKEKLFALNKAYKTGVLPKSKEMYKINIPIEKMYAFYLRYEKEEKRVKDKSYLLTYTVKMGDTLESIANMYDVPIVEIKEVNHLKDDALELDKMLVISVSRKKFEKFANKY